MARVDPTKVPSAVEGAAVGSLIGVKHQETERLCSGRCLPSIGGAAASSPERLRLRNLLTLPPMDAISLYHSADREPERSVHLPPAPIEPKPFVIENGRTDPQPNQRFTPSARVSFTPGLRTSGLLVSLPPEQLRTLLFVLTFVHPNGYCHPSVLELSRAMDLSPGGVRRAVGELTRFFWRGTPLVVTLARKGCLDAYSPSPHIIEQLVEAPPAATPPRVLRSAGKEAILAHSRAAYARPREEVEREIEAALGHSSSEPADHSVSGEQAGMERDLRRYGIPREQAAELLARYPRERIARQIAWLPYRHPNNPAGLLVAAIMNDYEEPLALRRQRKASDSARADPPSPSP